MQYINKTSLQNLINEHFDVISPERSALEILETFVVSVGEFADLNKNGFNRQLTFINDVTSFLFSLEKYKIEADEIKNLSKQRQASMEIAKEDVCLKLIEKHKNELQHFVDNFFKSISARKICFQLWDIYVTASGSEITNSWNKSKRSDIAFNFHHVSELFFDLETFKQPSYDA